MSLQELIDEALRRQPGEEFCLEYSGANYWCASICGRNEMIGIGEAGGKYDGEADTPAGAVAALLLDLPDMAKAP